MLARSRPRATTSIQVLSPGRAVPPPIEMSVLGAVTSTPSSPPVGFSVGGASVGGASVGGASVGVTDGGTSVGGTSVGGASDGVTDGGTSDGVNDGVSDGACDGACEGCWDGATLGAAPSPTVNMSESVASWAAWLQEPLALWQALTVAVFGVFGNTLLTVHVYVHVSPFSRCPSPSSPVGPASVQPAIPSSTLTVAKSPVPVDWTVIV